MFASQPFASRLLLALVVLGSALSGRMASAQDRDPPDNEPQKQGHAALSREQIDRLCAFASNDGAASSRARLESSLALQIDQIERVCGITEGQRKKLLLAGRGDIKRFFDLADESKRRLIQAGDRQEEAARIMRILQDLRASLQRGIFDERSLFVKTRKQALREEQNARLEVELDESRRFRHQAKVDLVVDLFDECLGLRDEQRQRLTKLLLVETRLPKRRLSADGEIAILILQAARVPEARFHPILEESQWPPLSHLLKRLEEAMKNEVNLEQADHDRPDDPGARPAEKSAPAPDREKGAKAEDR
jgi:hypothetical protein